MVPPDVDGLLAADEVGKGEGGEGNWITSQPKRMLDVLKKGSKNVHGTTRTRREEVFVLLAWTPQPRDPMCLHTLPRASSFSSHMYLHTHSRIELLRPFVPSRTLPHIDQASPATLWLVPFLISKLEK